MFTVRTGVFHKSDHKPTKRASKGDVPRSEWIVSEIPRVNIKIPTQKNTYFNLLYLFFYVFCCKYNMTKVDLI